MARRNNADRLGAPHPDAPTVPETTTESQADPLSFIVPTEFVALPSRGLHYPEGHALHGAESIEIKYMTAKEEDLLSSRSLIEKGLVLDRLIDSLLVNKQVRSRDLLIADRNAILIAARASGYGSDYGAKITCTDCGHADEYEYNLEEAVIQDPLGFDELGDIGVTQKTPETFEVTVPNSPVDIVFRLLNGHDERVMLDLSEKRKKKKVSDQLITDQLKQMIVSVMGHEDRDIIVRYVESLPLRDSRFLREIYDKVSPTITLRKGVVCNECGYEDDIIFPFTISFFWPDARV